MTLSTVLRLAGLSTFLFVFAGIAAAQGPVVLDDSTTSAQLDMSANVQTALQLNITAHASGVAVTPGAAGIFAIDLGDLNGLGSGDPDEGVSKEVDGVNGTTYTTPIVVTPVYSGFDGETATVTVEQGSGDDQAIAREGSLANNVGPVTDPEAAFSGAASESENTRYVGFYIARTEVAEAKEATFIYAVTMEVDTP